MARWDIVEDPNVPTELKRKLQETALEAWTLSQMGATLQGIDEQSAQLRELRRAAQDLATEAAMKLQTVGQAPQLEETDEDLFPSGPLSMPRGGAPAEVGGQQTFVLGSDETAKPTRVDVPGLQPSPQPQPQPTAPKAPGGQLSPEDEKALEEAEKLADEEQSRTRIPVMPGRVKYTQGPDGVYRPAGGWQPAQPQQAAPAGLVWGVMALIGSALVWILIRRR